jgi:polyhydroxyalkanoate synthesis regulator phasin
MTLIQTRAGYEQTKAKLRSLERRLAELGNRTDLSPIHLDEARKSYSDMMRQYRREIKLYEASRQQTGKSETSKR